MNKLILFSLLIWILQGQTGCGSGETRAKGSESKNQNSGSSGSGADSETVWENSPTVSGAGTTTPVIDAGPSKKELYDGIQISLGSGDDVVVEKSVANFLSHDQGDARALNALALYHMAKGRSHLAKMIFKSVLEKDTRNSVVLNNLGVLYSQQGDRRQATDSFRKALSVNPNYAVANANLGSIFASGRDYVKAKPYLEGAYKGGIKDISVLNNYATALMSDGDQLAENIFKEALQIGASDLTVSFNYAIYLTYVKKNYKEAGEVIDKIRFMGVPPQKKTALMKMEETISGRNNVETKAP